MRDIVRAVFYDFNLPMEADIPFFYQDLKGLVSIGVGLLCDPIQLALNLPMLKPDGTPAGRDSIAAEWLRVKNLSPAPDGRTAAQLGWTYAKPHTTLRLSPEGLRFTLQSKLAGNERTLIKGFPDFEEWSADAQLGALSMSWAVGPGFWSPDAGARYFPKLTAALRLRDYETASRECFLAEANKIGGLRPRNNVNRQLFLSAAVVDQQGLDPEVLHYRDLTKQSTLPAPPIDDDNAIVHSLHLAGLPGVGKGEA